MSHALLAKKPASEPASKGPFNGLQIGEPDDAFEREADRVADQVVTGGADFRPQRSLSRISIGAPLQRKCACGGSASLEDECENCREKKARLQRKSHGSTHTGEVPAQVDSALAAPGHPLDPATRRYFEPRFGHDFSRVRVHVDDAATDSVSAHAFTVGERIVFSASQYQPATPTGRRLLAHELTHVIQQTNPESLSSKGALEAEAHAAGDRASSGQHVAIRGAARAGTLQRKEGGLGQVRIVPKEDGTVGVFLFRDGKIVKGYGEVHPPKGISAKQAAAMIHTNVTWTDPLPQVEIVVPPDWGQQPINPSAPVRVIDTKVEHHQQEQAEAKEKVASMRKLYRQYLADTNYQIEKFGPAGAENLVPSPADTKSDAEIVALFKTDPIFAEWIQRQRWKAFRDQKQASGYEDMSVIKEAWQRQRQAERQEDEDAKEAAESPPLSEAEKLKRCQSGDYTGLKIFPIRMPKGIVRADVSAPSAEKTGSDIKVKLPWNEVRENKRFRQDTKTLPNETFLSGIHLAPDEVVGIRLYDQNEQVKCFTGEQMLKISAAGDTATMLSMMKTGVEAVSFMMPGAGEGLSRAASYGMGALVIGDEALIEAAQQQSAVYYGLQGKVHWDEILIDAFTNAVMSVGGSALADMVAARLIRTVNNPSVRAAIVVATKTFIQMSGNLLKQKAVELYQRHTAGARGATAKSRESTWSETLEELATDLVTTLGGEILNAAQAHEGPTSPKSYSTSTDEGIPKSGSAGIGHEPEHPDPNQPARRHEPEDARAALSKAKEGKPAKPPTKTVGDVQGSEGHEGTGARQHKRQAADQLHAEAIGKGASGSHTSEANDAAARGSGEATDAMAANEKILVKKHVEGTTHDVEVTSKGFRVCSDPPCPLFRRTYRNEIKDSSLLEEALEHAEKTAHSDPNSAGDEAKDLLKEIEQNRKKAGKTERRVTESSGSREERGNTIQEIFQEGEAKVTERGRALDDTRMSETEKPSPGAQPRPFQRGNFSHRFAEHILGPNELPRPNEAEVVVHLNDRTPDIIRTDRIVRNTERGVLIEIKPAGPSAARGRAQLPGRLEALQRYFPKRNGWTGRVVEYNPAQVEAWFRAEGVPAADIPALMSELGF
jgi:Domain of unknown function (DUF4157)/Putative RNase-like toxin, toxin_1